MDYPDAPEFQTSGAGGYSPDRFYTQSKNGPTGDRRWISLGRHTFPAEVIARIEDLIHLRKFPAYHTVGDFVRDAVVHHLVTRLGELRDPYWHMQRDVFAVLFEAERLQLEGQALEVTFERFQTMLENEKDPAKKERVRTKVADFADDVDGDYWRSRFKKLAE